MGRQETVYPNDVLVALEENNGSATRAQLGTMLGISEGTVSRKVAKLIKAGENIGFDKSGLFIQSKSDMHDPEEYDRAKAWTQRVVASLQMWAKRGNNHKPIAIEARKVFAKQLNADERQMLKSNLLLIARVVDAVDLDEELHR